MKTWSPGPDDEDLDSEVSVSALLSDSSLVGFAFLIPDLCSVVKHRSFLEEKEWSMKEKSLSLSNWD